MRSTSNQSSNRTLSQKTPRILNMRDTYVKVDGGDGGVVLKSIADVSCSFISNIVELYQ